MPYIENQTERQALTDAVDDLRVESLDEGEMNFLLTTIIDRWATRNGSFRYAESVHDVVALLECVKLEWYCRIASPYELLKRALNGPVAHKSQELINRAEDAARTHPGRD